MGKTETLLDELRKAYALASEFRGGYSERFIGAEQFAEALRDSIEKFSSGDTSVLREAQLWFYPTSDWDDLVGMDGLELGQRVSDLLNAYLDEAS